MLNSLIKNIAGVSGLTETPWGKTDSKTVEAALSISLVILVAAKAISWVCDGNPAASGSDQDKAA